MSFPRTRRSSGRCFVGDRATFTFTGADNLTPVGGLTFAHRLDGGPFSAFSSSTTTEFTGLTPGAHTFEVKAQDLAGNEDPTPAARTFLIDTIPPTITITSPAETTVSGIITVGASATDPSGITSLTFLNPSGLIDADPAPDRFSASFDTKTVPNGPLTLTATATDGAGNTGTASRTVAVANVLVNHPPVLTPLGDQTVDLGSTLSFTVSATDPDGDPLTFSVTPVPLPANATFNTRAGVFTFTSNATQVGTFTLTFTVSDDSLTDSETITLTVPAPLPGAPTRFTGRLLDANAFAMAQVLPVVGATVAFLGTGRSAQSDPQGVFTLTDLPADAQVLDIDPATAQPAPDGSRYAGFREALSLIPGVENVIDRPFFLPRIAASSLTPVNPNATTVVTNPELKVSLTIPPHTAKNPDGTDFTGQLSISPVPKNLTPRALPDTLNPGLVITIQPVGVTFATPVPLTFPNLDALPPGSELNLWSLDPATGAFAVVGLGRVSADGNRIETVRGGVRAADWHFFLPPSPVGDKRDHNEDNEDTTKCCDLSIGSRASARSGTLTLDHPLPAVRAFGRAQALRVVYTSETAAPQPIIPATATILTRVAVPQTVSTRLRVGRIEQGRETFMDTRGLDESRDEATRQVVQFDATALSTGRYPYRLTLTSHYLTSSVSTAVEGNVLVYNQRESPFGAGWSLAGLQRLHLDSAGNALLVDGDGSVHFFARGVSGATGLNVPEGLAVDSAGNLYVSENPSGTDQDRLLKITPDGTVTVFDTNATGISNPDGLAFDSAGNLSVSNNGDSQLFRYLNADPTRRQTFVAFPNIRQPLGLAFDSQGNLYIVNNSDAGQPQVSFPDNFVTKVSPTGAVLAFLGPFPDPLDVAVDSKDHVYVTSQVDSTVWRIAPTGELVLFTTEVNRPFGLAIDATDTIYMANSGNGTIVRLSPEGIPEVIASGFIGGLAHLDVDPAGNLLAADQGVGQVVRTILNPTQVATFIAPRGEFSTLVHNVDDTFTRTLKDGTRIEFNAQGFQTAVVDRNGNTTIYAYDAQDRLVAITDPMGQVTIFAYDGAGKLQRVTDPADRVTTFAHGAEGNLTQITNPDGSTVQFTYDAAHRLISRTDPRGFVTTYTYDFAGRFLRSMDFLGATRQLRSSQMVGLVDPTSGLGTPTNPAPLVRPEEAVALSTDARGNVTRMTTDRFGAATQVVDSLGRMTQIQRDANSLPTRITRPNGSIVTLTYDTRGNLVTSKEEAIGATTTFTYEPQFNQVTSIKDPKGNSTTITYDSQGNPISIRDALGNITTLTYDGRGLLTSTTDAFGQRTTLSYDARGNLLTTIDPLGHTTALAYDAASNVVTSTDALGRITTFTYDALNRLTSVTDAAGGTTRYTYDLAGNLVSATDASGHVTTFEYNAVNQLIQITNPLGQSKTFGYDLARNLVSTTDARDQTISFTYDAANQLLQKTLPGNQVTTFAYDAVGNLTSAVDPDSHLTFTYDALGRLLQAQMGGPIQPTMTIGYTYDANSNRFTLTDPQGGVTSYGYDALNRLTALTSPQGTTTFAYDALSRRTALTLPNGSRATYAYDAASQLTTLQHLDPTAVLLAQFQYTYDAVGNRTMFTELPRVRTYTYDALNRLLSATHPTLPTPETFSYDPVGNRLSASGVTATFDAANRLTEETNFTYTYDANGNLLTKRDKATDEVTTYTYDAESQLIQVSQPGMTATYRYDALGRRIEKSVNGMITRYIYDNEDILLELDGTNQVLAHYTYGPGIDEPLVMFRGGQSFFYHVDGLGSITHLTDAAGNAVQSYTYDSFGQIVAETGTLTNPYTYTAREFDAETGLYYYRARHLDPALGRFLQEDPLFRPRPGPKSSLITVQGVASGGQSLPVESILLIFRNRPENLHPYTYVRNNPVNFIDPSGEITECNRQLLDFFVKCFAISFAVTDLPIGTALIGCAFTGPFALQCTQIVLVRAAVIEGIAAITCAAAGIQQQMECRQREQCGRR